MDSKCSSRKLAVNSILALAMILSGCAYEAELGHEELAISQAPLQVTEEWEAIQAFKEEHTYQDLYANPALRMEYKALVDAATGSNLSQEVAMKKQSYADADDFAPGLMTSEQLASGNDLVDATAGGAMVFYSGKSKTPSSIQEMNIVTSSFDPMEALAEIKLLHWHLIDGIYAIGEDEELVESIVDFSNEEVTGFVVEYDRLVNDLVVVGDFLKLYFVVDLDRWSQGYILRQVVGKWHRDASSEAATKTPAITNTLANAVAIAAFEEKLPDLGYETAKSSTLHIYPYKGVCHLAYRVEVSSADALTESDAKRGYEIDAVSGEIITDENLINYSYTGTLKIQATKPHDPYTGISSKSYHPAPYTAIYDDTEYRSLSGDECPSTVIVGDDAEYLGLTDAAGNFTNIDSSDGDIYVDGNAGYFYVSPTPLDDYYGVDHSSWHPSGYDNCDLTSDARPITNGNFSIPWNYLGTWNGRLAEVKWHVDVAKMFAIDLGVMSYEPLFYSYRSSDDNINDIEGICGGWTDTNFIWINCDYEFDVDGTYNTKESEASFRDAIYHEFGHSVHNWYGMSVPSGYYASIAKEGFAMYTAGIMSLLEGQQYAWVGASRTWPSEDVDCSDNCAAATGTYKRGSIFTAIFNDFTLLYSNSAYRPITMMLEDIDEETWMVGQCTTPYDWSTCKQTCDSPASSNTYFRKLLTEGTVYAADYEISKAFHNHIDDAYPRSSGTCSGTDPEHLMPSYNWHNETTNNSFPYKDGVTDFYRLAPMISTEKPVTVLSSTTAFELIDYIPDEFGNQELFFFSTSDDDMFTFVGRAGETYLINTLNLSTGVDTLLKVRNETGSSVLASNDDCSVGTLRSCVSFTPTTTALYKIQVYTDSSTSTGQSKTYNLRIDVSGDDYADLAAKAHPVQPIATHTEGYINSSTDQDWFYFILEDTNSVLYRMCHSSTNTATMKIYDSSMTEKASTTGSTSCVARDSSVSLNAGIYYVKLTGTTGWYEFHTMFNDDISYDAGSAIDLVYTSVPSYLSGDVIFYPTEFEDASDAIAGDFFVFDGDQGETWCFDTIDVESGIETTLHIYSPNTLFYGIDVNDNDFPDDNTTEIMFEDQDGGVGDRGSHMCFVIPVDEDYYLSITGSGAGGYTLAAWNYPTSLTSYPQYPGD